MPKMDRQGGERIGLSTPPRPRSPTTAGFRDRVEVAERGQGQITPCLAQQIDKTTEWHTRKNDFELKEIFEQSRRMIGSRSQSDG